MVVRKGELIDTDRGRWSFVDAGVEWRMMYDLR